MKIALLSFLAGLFFVGSLAVYTKEAIIKDYGKIFTAKVTAAGDQKKITKGIKKLPASHFLADMVNNNPRMIDYLVDNYTTLDTTKMNSLTGDPAALDKAYIASLQADSTFNKAFIEMAGHFLASKDSEIKGETFTKDTMSVDELATIAAKFFHADAVGADGNIKWKIGAGIDNMAQLQGTPHPIAEAFSYATILTNYNKSAGMKDDFMKGASQVQGEQKVVVGSISDTTLMAVRKGVNDFMANSAGLKQALQQEYETKKDVLNFVLSGSNANDADDKDIEPKENAAEGDTTKPADNKN
ncbi:hypothetical protein Q0590_21595 [Rhodocytophaga aerolata]|uniref:Uncharacterized protein n=1 Tax=Rhodocytophaga aerolata TaxID=455078 RepID=A0ABT8RDS3_9BACT|nr:hypothetical protein [Rhodocytophaga aerolata]MDO1448887.1 hypothetical protein [Rhodocytophaga aerolata]